MSSRSPQSPPRPPGDTPGVAVTGRRRPERELGLDAALQRLRDAILQMRNERDWDDVAILFHRELDQLVPADAIGINVVDLVSDTWVEYYVDAGGLQRDHRTAVPPAVRKALETAAPVYRRNREEMARLDTPPHLAASGVQSVLDVPFASGVLAVNSTREHAFAHREIEILTQFAHVMSEARRRFQDLRDLALAERRAGDVQRLEMIGDLAASIAHEINNPLTSVIGYSQVLLRLDLPAPVRERLEMIRREGERAQVISQRLQAFAQVQNADRQVVDLNELVQSTLTLLRFRLESMHISLTDELSPELPWVDVDAGQLQQLIMNLIQNSREAIERHGGRGRILVCTTCRDHRVLLSVEDDGPGIAEEDLCRVFEPFFTTGKTGRNVGLGLSLSHGVARAHDGELRAEPRSCGSCLVLDLPALTETECRGSATSVRFP